MSGLAVPLAGVGAILLAAGAAGWGIAGALVPRGSVWLAERVGWGFAAGLGVLAASAAVAFALRSPPGWFPFLVLAAAAALPAILFRIRERSEAFGRTERFDALSIILLLLLLAGVALYALRALSEPMWANDYLAIWGFKGKTFFAEGNVPDRLFRWRSLSFSHPEYPLGLPLLYAGIASLLGRWDDHAMALAFPFLQGATLLALFGWLRRRGAARPLALAAAALLSHFEPLYRAFTTGMADVPLSFGLLLLGTSLSDRLDRTDRGASRRVVLASVVCAATKNEGLFLVGAAFVLAAVFSLSRRGLVVRAAVLLALPAALVVAAHRFVRGSLPLSDFDFSLLSKPAALFPRTAESLSSVVRETPLSAWIGVGAFVVLLAAGRRSSAGDLLLALAACGLCAYLLLPAFAVAGPAWLVQTAFFRTTAALAPLVFAGAAARLVPVFVKRES